MIKCGQSPLLSENLDGLGSAGSSRRQSTIDCIAVALRADDHAIESVDRQDDAGEHNPANNPKLAHRAHRVLAGSKQFGETSMP